MLSRRNDNGGVIGVDNAPTLAVASGVWRMDAVDQYQRQTLWPRSPISVSYAGTPTPQTADQTTYTFSSAAIGAAADDRIVVVGFAGRANAARTVSTVTIGGVTATHIDTANDPGGGADIATLWMLLVPAGTTANLAITFSGSMLRCACFVWAVYGSTNTASAFSSATDISVSASALSVSAASRPNGALIAVAWIAGGANQTASWTNITEDAENNPETTSNMASGAHVLTTGSSNVTVSVSSSGTSPANGGLVVGTFAP